VSVYCQVEVSASCSSLVQRRPTECCGSECDRESSTKTRPWPTRDCLVGSIPETARSKAWVCGRSLVGIEGSNPAGNTDVCLLCVFM